MFQRPRFRRGVAIFLLAIFALSGVAALDACAAIGLVAGAVVALPAGLARPRAWPWVTGGGVFVGVALAVLLHVWATQEVVIRNQTGMTLRELHLTVVGSNRILGPIALNKGVGVRTTYHDLLHHRGLAAGGELEDGRPIEPELPEDPTRYRGTTEIVIGADAVARHKYD